MRESADRIHKAATGTPEEHLIIFLAHNGPTGNLLRSENRTFECVGFLYQTSGLLVWQDLVLVWMTYAAKIGSTAVGTMGIQVIQLGFNFSLA